MRKKGRLFEAKDAEDAMYLDKSPEYWAVILSEAISEIGNL